MIRNDITPIIKNVILVMFSFMVLGFAGSTAEAQSMEAQSIEAQSVVPNRSLVASGTAIFTARNDTNFAFGTVPVGKKMEKTFYFANTGTDTLFIQSLELDADSAFTIQFASLTLAPKRSGKVIVQFAPTAAKDCRGSIAFVVANGVASPTLSLSGSGAFPAGTNTSLLTGTAGGRFQQGDH